MSDICYSNGILTFKSDKNTTQISQFITNTVHNGISSIIPFTYTFKSI